MKSIFDQTYDAHHPLQTFEEGHVDYFYKFLFHIGFDYDMGRQSGVTLTVYCKRFEDIIWSGNGEQFITVCLHI